MTPTGAANYRVEESTDGGNTWSQIAGLGAAASSIVLSTLV